MKITETKWHPREKLIATTIIGEVDEQDITRWRDSLGEVFDKIKDNSSFKIFVNLHGFKAVNFDVHKKFRVIIPSTLANYNFRVGYLNLFPEAEVKLKTTRGIQCVAAVHVHHDESKINYYDTQFGSDKERFFTHPEVAEKWIHAITVSE